MPLPKRRQSSDRRDKRRSHDALTAPAVVSCTQCGEPCRPHHLCSKCGYYKGKKIIETKEAKK